MKLQRAWKPVPNQTKRRQPRKARKTSIETIQAVINILRRSPTVKVQEKWQHQEKTVKKKQMVRVQNHIDQYDFIHLFLITSYFPQRKWIDKQRSNGNRQKCFWKYENHTNAEPIFYSTKWCFFHHSQHLWEKWNSSVNGRTSQPSKDQTFWSLHLWNKPSFC